MTSFHRSPFLQFPVGAIWPGDGHHGDTHYVVSFYHFVNRIGYLISTVPVPEGPCIEVALDTA